MQVFTEGKYCFYHQALIPRFIKTYSPAVSSCVKTCLGHTELYNSKRKSVTGVCSVCVAFNPGTVNAKTALSGLDLVLEDGDFVTVIGGNGAGKSTLLNAIAGVFKPDYGTIELDGIDVSNMPEHKRAKFLGRVFQDPMKGTAPDMEIAENLSIAARRGTKRKLVWGIRRGE